MCNWYIFTNRVTKIGLERTQRAPQVAPPSVHGRHYAAAAHIRPPRGPPDAVRRMTTQLRCCPIDGAYYNVCGRLHGCINRWH